MHVGFQGRKEAFDVWSRCYNEALGAMPEAENDHAVINGRRKPKKIKNK